MALAVNELIRRINPEKIRFQMLNESLLELDRGNPKKLRPPHIKFATPEAVVSNQLTAIKPDRLMLLVVDAEEWSRVIAELKNDGLIQ